MTLHFKGFFFELIAKRCVVETDFIRSFFLKILNRPISVHRVEKHFVFLYINKIYFSKLE